MFINGAHYTYSAVHPWSSLSVSWLPLAERIKRTACVDAAKSELIENVTKHTVPMQYLSVCVCIKSLIKVCVCVCVCVCKTIDKSVGCFISVCVCVKPLINVLDVSLLCVCVKPLIKSVGCFVSVCV